jgi:hypothetical protein
VKLIVIVAHVAKTVIEIDYNKDNKLEVALLFDGLGKRSLSFCCLSSAIVNIVSAGARHFET